MKIYQVERLLKMYGDISLSEVIERMKGKNKYQCPKCAGLGEISYIVQHGVYGYSDDVWGTKDCDLCKGIGYTERPYKPVYKKEIIGYE